MAAAGLALVAGLASARLAAAGDGAPAAPDSAACEGLPIRRVEIRPGPVFDPGPGGGLSEVERFANRLHFRTHRGTIQRQLLFGPGDRWSDALGHESARNLRALGFLDPGPIAARREGDSVVVSVETRDLWRTSPHLNVASAEGRRVGSIGVIEGNLLGYGKSIAVVYRDDENGKSWNFGYLDPNLGGSPLRLHYLAGNGSEGATDQVSLELPFLAVQTPRAWHAGWNRTTQVVHLFADGAEAASLDQRVERAELWYGGRLSGGEPSASGRTRQPVQRLTGGFELYDRRFGASRLEPGSPPQFAGAEENIRIRRLGAELTVWQPKFTERANINRVDRVEDFDLGPKIGLMAGYALSALGSSQDEGYLRAGVDLGADTRFGFGLLRSQASTRLDPDPVERIVQLNAHWYAPWRRRHTLALGALGIAGAETPRDFQARAGGLEGLRAFPINVVAGQRLWRLNAEERWRFWPESWQKVRVGSAVFFDAARAWGAGAEGTGWFRDAGLGLRLGVPSWGLSEALRVDLAWPIEPGRDGGHQPVFTFGSRQAF